MRLPIFLALLAIAKTQLSQNHFYKKLNVINEERRIISSLVVPSLINTPYPGVANYTLYETARLGLLISNANSIVPEFGPVLNAVTSLNYPITIKRCGDIEQRRQSAFIAVISAADNFEKREKIRQTWKSHIDFVRKFKLFNIQFSFILGQSEDAFTQRKIQEESKTHDDIIQFEMLDTHRNLPLKMAGLFNWVNTICPKLDFLLKLDDEMYLNVHVLANFVNTYRQLGKMTIFGQSPRKGYPFINNWGPQRSGMHEIALEEWPWNTYPNYVNGPAYLIHQTAILPLLAAIQTTPIMPFEDIYITGICSEKAGVVTQYSSGYNR
ncbi:hypothetical protein DAPPUDRAFT_241308 [Daphnia pulex]|uniref:Hexosyltransferase n=1 Tax=Daphnia pulex TaxID=6669 RepID=E9GDY0_DAPPU|nr:hypothetical protein DAPPUDRAFT_241308 [Daphnia pulex]|eukprot:EFX82405.1 hypothetical protein DAPPUDRAFT_241308 [Daphnia pulex]